MSFIETWLHKFLIFLNNYQDWSHNNSILQGLQPGDGNWMMDGSVAELCSTQELMTRYYDLRGIGGTCLG